MNCLVTGGLGFIGAHTSVKLIENGYNVIIFDNLSNSNIQVLDKIEMITKTKPEFIKGDIRDELLLEQIFGLAMNLVTLLKK